MLPENMKRLAEALGKEGWAFTSVKLVDSLAGVYELHIMPATNARMLPQPSPCRDRDRVKDPPR